MPVLVGMLIWSTSLSCCIHAEFRDLDYLQLKLPLGLEPQVCAYVSAVSHLSALTGPHSDYGAASGLHHPQLVSTERKKCFSFCDPLPPGT